MAKKKRNYSDLRFKRKIAVELTEKTSVLHEVHHRHPRSRRRTYDGNINEDRNLSVVPYNKHKAWHTITNGNQMPKEWIKEVNECYMPPDWYLVAVPRHKPPRNPRRERCYCDDCQCEVLRYIPKCHKEKR